MRAREQLAIYGFVRFGLVCPALAHDGRLLTGLSCFYNDIGCAGRYRA